MLSVPRRRKVVVPEVIVSLYNCGKHLYLDPDRLPMGSWYVSPLQTLRFKEYCGRGQQIYSSVYLIHLGHKYGILGGEASAEVEYRLSVYRLNIQPKELVQLVWANGDAFVLRQDLFLPWRLAHL